MNVINEINAKICIKKDDINKYIRIINSYEQYTREFKLRAKKDDYKKENEKEIKGNCEIKINNIIISFSYFYKFPEEGILILNIHLKMI